MYTFRDIYVHSIHTNIAQFLFFRMQGWKEHKCGKGGKT